jgi:nucleoside-diphosphate-sugar epimerase
LRSVLIVGSTSTVGRAIGAHLNPDCRVSYAGRSNADYSIDLESDDSKAMAGARFDTVINVAAGFSGSSPHDFIRAAFLNTVGALRVCRIATEVFASHVVLMSSASADLPIEHSLYNVYASSKRHGDELADLYCRKFCMPLAIIRPTQIYDAAGACRKHQSTFYRIVDEASKGSDIMLEGAHDPLRNYIFLDDLSKVVKRVVELRATGIFRCAGPSNTSLGDLARETFSVFKQSGDVLFDKSLPAIEDLALDGYQAEILRKQIGVAATTTLTEGLQAIKRFRDGEL